MPIPTDTIDKLEAIWTSTSALCATLVDAEWNLLTDLPGWTVQDNLAHMIGTERSLEGLPLAGRLDAFPNHVKNPIGEFNEGELEARRQLTGPEVLAEWNDLVQRRLATLRGADESYFARDMMTPTGPGTMADFLHIRVLDCWVHEQDMRRAVGRAGHLDGPAAEHTIDRLLRTLPIVVGKRAATPEGRAVVLDLTGPVQRHVVCEVNGGRAAVVETPKEEPLATIRMDSETFVVLANGRRTGSAMADRISISGDTALGQKVIDNLNMMI
jgi:uncharacterized protein (TIGR03083 family)